MTRRAFAAKVRLALVISLLTSFALIGQSRTIVLYQVGLVLLAVSVVLQFGFGNVAPTAGVRESLKMVLVAVIAVSVVFGGGILLAPYLTMLGR